MNAKHSQIRTQKSRNLIFYCCMLGLPVLQFCIFYIYVNFNSILLAFQEYKDGNYIFAGFQNFKDLWGMFSGKIISADAITLRNSLKNSLIAFTMSLLVRFPIVIIISFYIYKKSSYIFKTLVFIPVIIPVTVNTLIFRQMTDSVLVWIVKLCNPLSEFQGLLFPQNATSFGTVVFYSIFYSFGSTMLILTSSMTAIPTEQVEAAELDGANTLQELWYITLPSIYPILVTMIVVTFANFFNNQENLFSFYGSEAASEMYTMGYYIYVKAQGARRINFPQLAALGVVLTIIIAPVTYFVRGILNKVGPSD